MRAVLFILSLSLVTTLTHAQDTIAHEKKGIISAIRQKLKAPIKKIREPSLSIINPTDTLNLPVPDSLTLKQKFDSIHRVSNQNKLASPQYPIDNINQRASTVSVKVDSLQKQINTPIDGVNKRISSVENSTGPRLTDVNQSINDKIDQLEREVRQGFDKATDGEVNVPGNLNTQHAILKLPDTEGNIPGLNVQDAKLPGLNTDIRNADLPFVELNDNLNVDRLKEEIDIDIPEADKIKDVTGEINKADSKLAEAEKYEAELQQIKQGDLRSTEAISKKAEEKLGNIEQIKGVSEQTQKVAQQQAQYEAMIQKYRDKKFAQEEVMRKAQNVVNDKLNKFSPAVKDVEQQIAKARKFNPSAKRLKEITKRTNPMKGKPFYERVVPGVTLQVYNKDYFTIDWGLQAGYKLSGRLLLGAGGVYRMGISENFSSWVKGMDVYGYRVYSDFKLLKGFYFHGEFESLHVGSYLHPLTNVEQSRHQAYNGYFGAGRRYDISKKIRGTILLLYRAEFEGHLPAMSKVNLRVGFDYNTKKRKKVA